MKNHLKLGLWGNPKGVPQSPWPLVPARGRVPGATDFGEPPWGSPKGQASNDFSRSREIFEKIPENEVHQETLYFKNIVNLGCTTKKLYSMICENISIWKISDFPESQVPPAGGT